MVIAAKSTEPTPNLPGSIYTVAAEAEALGVQALPYQVDLRDEKQSTACVEATLARWGRVDILVNNVRPSSSAARLFMCPTAVK